MEDEDKVCSGGSCKNSVAELHSCPFEKEINDNFDEECNCCDRCAGECALDI